MTSFNGYRTPTIAGGGLRNGYATPRAKQDWTIGEVVSVGFVRNLEVIKNVGDRFVLWQATANRFYSFRPHLGLSRCDNLADALSA